MRHRTLKFRRVTAAVVLGMGMTAGVIGVTAGTAGAVTQTTNGVWATSPALAITSTGTSQLAGTLEVTLAPLGRSTETLVLTAAASNGGSVHWSHVPTVVGVNATAASPAITGTNPSKLDITVSTVSTTTADHITLSTIRYTTSGAGGPITVSATLSTTSFSPNAAENAYAPVFGGPSRGNAITATSAPSVSSTGTGNAAGSLTVTLRGTATTAAGATYVNLTTTATRGSVFWNSATLTSTGVAASYSTPPGGATGISNEVTIKVGALASGTSATLHLTGVSYNTTGAKGTVTVTPTWVNSPTPATVTVTEGTFNPATAVNAKAPALPTTRALHHTFTAKTTPPVGLKVTGAAAGNWTLHLTSTTSTATVAKKEGWTKTTTVTVVVDTNAGTNCTTATNYVLVTGTPTATVGTAKTVSVTPTVTVSAAATGTACKVNDHNVVSLTFSNSGTFTGKTGSFHIVVAGVKYDVGATAPTGNVSVSAEFTDAVEATEAPFQAASITGATTGPSNADVTLLYVSANTPAVTLAATAFDAAISPINSVETSPAQIPVSYVCVSLTSGNVFNTAASATAKVTKGTGTVTSTVSYETSAGVKATTTANAFYARFKVTKESATTATTYSLSGLKVNASNAAGTTVTATVKHVPTATNCSASGTSIGSATAYSIKKAAPVQIYGQTADATAAKLVETRFPATDANPTTTPGGCPGVTNATKNNRPIILATTEHYQDALSSQYLASYLKTGTLLTPTAKLSTVTLNALKTEGITQVDVVGGPLVVSTTVIAQLETTPAYTCGGGSKLTVSGGGTRFITVTRIYGHTATETAKAIAESAPTTHVSSLVFTTAYLGVNATKGNGAFNDTAGSGSPVPLSAAPAKTAILASTTEFQDAMAASALSYWQKTGTTGVPILLTNPMALSSAAQAAIATLGIKQVILMGGQLAVTNSVVTSLESLGVSVLRVAGHTYTDTATQLAKFEESKAGMGLNWDTTTFAVARGNGFTDALVGADVAGKVPEPMLLTTSPTVVGKYLTAFLKAHGATGTAIDTDGTGGGKLSSFTVFGGPLAVSPAVVSQMETDIS